MTREELFSAERYSKTRLPLLQAEGLPADTYTDERFFRREMEAVFGRSWMMAGREDRIPNEGDFFTVDHAGANLIVIRDKDGSIKAHANVCRHRGARLVDVPAGKMSGHATSLTCTYHAWNYSLDGWLRACAGMEDTQNFDRADYSLVSARVGCWGGFVWVCLSGDAPPLLEWLGELPGRLEMYGLEDMVATRIVTHEIDCNWKTWVENFMEGYHIPTVHRSTISKLKAVNMPEHPRGNGSTRPSSSSTTAPWRCFPATRAFLPSRLCMATRCGAVASCWSTR